MTFCKVLRTLILKLELTYPLTQSLSQRFKWELIDGLTVQINPSSSATKSIKEDEENEQEDEGKVDEQRGIVLISKLGDNM